MENTIIKNANVEYSLKICIPMNTPVCFLLSDKPKYQEEFLKKLMDIYPENRIAFTSTIQIINYANKLNAFDIQISSIDAPKKEIKIEMKFINLNNFNNFCLLFK